MKLKNVRICLRLSVGFGVILVLMVLLAGTAIWRLQRIGAITERMINEEVAKERVMLEWQAGLDLVSTRALAALKNPDPAAQKYFYDLAKQGSSSVLQKRVEEMVKDEIGKAILVDIAAKRAATRAVSEPIFELKAAGNEEATKKLLDQKLIPATAAYAADVAKLVRHERAQIDAMVADLDTQYREDCTFLILLSVVAVGLGVGFAYWIARSITYPLGKAVETANRVAQGDLTSRIEVTSQDETGQLLQALQNMNANLVKIVGEVRTGTETIASASTQIASGNLDLSSRTEEQASSLEETASSMEELTSTVKHNADNAHQANKLAAAASGVAKKGGDVVSQVVETMSAINTSSEKIMDIISVIDSIAFQTNILALNAAVEAARAGEQGRGFAVVAAEVRSLAQRCAGAAKEIKELIDDSVTKVDTGSRLVEQAGETMHEIVESVQRVTDIMSEISAASAEQSSGIEQVNRAIAQMDEVTQQNASLVEEAAAAAQSLQDQAANLAKAVAVFRLNDTQAATLKAYPPAKSITTMTTHRVPDRQAVAVEKAAVSLSAP